MTVAMCLPLVVSALLGLSASRAASRLPPATAVRLLGVAAVVTALGTGFVLAVAGVLVVAEIPPIAALGHWSGAVVGSRLPVPLVAGWLAAATFCGLLLAASRRTARAGRDLVLAAVACRRLGPSVAGLVVVDDEDPDAYALPGLGGRIVVTTAMLRALPADERRVLLAHEAAHLRHRHHLWVQAAEVAAAANPLLRPVARAVTAGVERWADEVAAAEVGDRALTARALARAGLARSAVRGGRAGTAAVLAAADGAVAERARAMLAGPLPGRRLLSAALAMLTLATGAATLVTSRDAESRFEAAQSAYVAGAPAIVDYYSSS